MKNTITIILLLAACGTGDGSTTEDPLTSGFIETTESSSEDTSSTSGDESSSSDGEDSSTDEGESSTGEPVECEPEIRSEHQPCGLSCVSDCGPGTVCRLNYAGGALAECETKCADDSQCSVGDVCSENHCVTPCDVNGGCAEGFYCYPPKLLDGTQVIDPAHPLPHCMPTKG